MSSFKRSPVSDSLDQPMRKQARREYQTNVSSHETQQPLHSQSPHLDNTQSEPSLLRKLAESLTVPRNKKIFHRMIFRISEDSECVNPFHITFEDEAEGGE